MERVKRVDSAKVSRAPAYSLTGKTMATPRARLMRNFNRWLSAWLLKTRKSFPSLSTLWRKLRAYVTKSILERQWLSINAAATLFESTQPRTLTFTTSFSWVHARTIKCCTRCYLRMKSYVQPSQALPAQKSKWRWTCLYPLTSSTKSNSRTRRRTRKRKSKNRWRRPSKVVLSQAQARTQPLPPKTSWMRVKQAHNLCLLSRRALWLQVVLQPLRRLKSPPNPHLTLLAKRVRRGPVVLKREFLLQAMISW